MLASEIDENVIRYYDEINIAYGTEEEKEAIRQDLINELSSFMTSEEIELAYIEETKDMIANKDVKVKLLKDYRKWGTEAFKKGAIGVVHDWKYFRFRSYNWYYAYVLVDIDGEEAAVNIDALQVLDKNFIEAEEKYFKKYEETFSYDKENHELTLNDELSFHCSSLCRRILGYLDPDMVSLVTEK